LRAAAAASCLLFALAASAASAQDKYAPLTKAQYDSFAGDSVRLSACLRDPLGKFSEAEIAKRIAAAGMEPALIADARRVLADEPAFRKAVAREPASAAARARIAMASLQARGAMGHATLAGVLRTHGVLRRYQAVAVAPACQPTPKFLSLLKVLLDENL